MAHFSDSTKMLNAELVRHIEHIMGNVREEHFAHKYLNDLVAYFADEKVASGVSLGEGPIDVDAGTSTDLIKDDKGPPSIEDVLDKYHPVICYAELKDLRKKATAWRVHYDARLKATDAVFEVLEALLEGAES